MQYPINKILDHKEHKTIDTNKIIIKYTLYLCQWNLLNS
jgi:hypothetical protein